MSDEAAQSSRVKNLVVGDGNCGPQVLLLVMNGTKVANDAGFNF